MIVVNRHLILYVETDNLFYLCQKLKLNQHHEKNYSITFYLLYLF